MPAIKEIEMFKYSGGLMQEHPVRLNVVYETGTPV
jgi:hypothetical protein